MKANSFLVLPQGLSFDCSEAQKVLNKKYQFYTSRQITFIWVMNFRGVPAIQMKELNYGL